MICIIYLLFCIIFVDCVINKKLFFFNFNNTIKRLQITRILNDNMNYNDTLYICSWSVLFFFVRHKLTRNISKIDIVATCGYASVLQYKAVHTRDSTCFATFV